MSTTVISPLLTREQAAEYLGLKISTLENWACNRRYRLPVVKIGRLSKYRLSDLERFVAERTVGGEN